MNPQAAPSHPPFLATIFDLSFRRFITPRLIPVLYVLGLIVVLIYSLGIANNASALVATSGGPAVAVGIIVFVVALCAGILYARVVAEVSAVVFRVYEQVADPGAGPVD